MGRPPDINRCRQLRDDFMNLTSIDWAFYLDQTGFAIRGGELVSVGLLGKAGTRGVHLASSWNLKQKKLNVV